MNRKKIDDAGRIAAEILIKIGAVSFRFDPPYTYTSGLKSPIYLDNRLVMSFPKERKVITDLYVRAIVEKIGLKKVDFVSATATAAIPCGAWVAGKLNLPMVYVRPTTKSYGKGNQIEGVFKKGGRAVIVEDHISTAASVLGNAQVIRQAGARVKYCVATTWYETAIARKTLEENKLVLLALTTGKSIVETAFGKKKLDLEQKKMVDDWFIDPQNWAKKYNL